MATRRTAFAQKIYRRCLRLYPRAFAERFAESMEQTFSDMCAELEESGHGIVHLLFRTLPETGLQIIKEHLLALNAIRLSGHADSRSAVAGILLCLPIAFIYVIAVFNIEPVNGFFLRMTTEADGRQKGVFLAMIMGAMLLMPVALAVNLAPIVRTAKTGGDILRTRPMNLIVAAIAAAGILYLWGGLIADQIPCFMGVPNCD